MRKQHIFPPGMTVLLLCLAICYSSLGVAQATFPVNGVSEPKNRCYAFTNATIVKDAQTTLTGATLVIRKDKIVAVGTNVTLPKDAIVIDCKGKYIYPSFIDSYSDYGMPVTTRAPSAFNFSGPAQLTSNQKGAFGWNQALHSEINAANIFIVDDAKARPLREAGFGTALVHQKDGIVRGTGAIVTLATEKENLVIIKEKASANYSLNKGTSTQSYPSSIMGSVALLRQTYLDAQWYKSKPATEGLNLSLQAFNDNQGLPQIFESNDKWTDLRGDRIGDEAGVQYIIRGGGNEYERINDIAGTRASYIIPLSFPAAMDVEDPNDARFVSLGDMKNWELAPGNPAAMEKANIPFAITAADLRDTKTFMVNLRKSIEYGLTETRALEALTKTPATMLGIYDMVGSLDANKLANFIITSGPVFHEKTIMLQNWIQGDKYAINDVDWSPVAGIYNLVLMGAGGQTNYTLDVKSNNSASVIGKDTLPAKFSYNGKLVSLSFSTAPPPKGRMGGMNGDSSKRTTRPDSGMAMRGGGRGTGAPATAAIRLSGTSSGNSWQGNGIDTSGNNLLWTASFVKAAAEKPDTSKRKTPLKLGKVVYPFSGYGFEEMPKAENLLIRNATVWTNEKEGRLENTDVLIKNGKIVQVGKGLPEAGATVIDGTGKHLTAGIIDEHSHIAAFSINEGAQSVTSEVRIGDNLNPDDINIYRQLSGGVTSSHILHGSANSIGGQTQLIKLRWGANDEDLKFKGADPFIKFALGENVKRTTATQGNNRFPDTRMGVEEVFMDAFQRASDYQAAMKAGGTTTTTAKGKRGATTTTVSPVRRDLELDALVEIMNKKRFITCHSYVQSEITALMRVVEKFGFRVNTFTHILEGYKVADKMKEHGANVSTFSDWWYYKQEVVDAIPYNAGIMHDVGLNVCINSDDAEQARRLNQEAAKSVKYNGMSEEEALKMVTLNPAVALHVADKVGSIKVGKDADVVLWTDNPLSIYAIADKTIVDGIVYYDRVRDAQLRKQISAERNRLVTKLMGEKRSGAPMIPAVPSFQVILNCGDHGTHDRLITSEVSDDDNNAAASVNANK